MKYFKTEHNTTPVKILTKIKCDKCDGELRHKDRYYEATSGHHLWGSDSNQSIDVHDFCSMKCVNKAMRKYFKDVRNEETHYFNVSHARVFLDKSVI